MLHEMRWTETKIRQRLELIEPLVYRRRQPLASFRHMTLPDPLTDPPIGIEVDDSDWETIEPDSYWGIWMTDYALRTSFQVPQDWDADSPVALYLPLGEAGDFSHPEGLAYIDGEPYAACDRHHQEILLPDKWRDGKSHLLALHTWTGLGGWRFDSPATKLFMRTCEVVQLDQPTRDFVATARVALGIASALDENAPAKGNLLNALDEAFKILDTRAPLADRFYNSVAPAHAALQAGIDLAGAPMDVDVVGVGHAHIDVAWLWTLGQTRRKSGRTFHTVLRLMEQFPDYHFVQSQPQLYDYIQEDYPGLLDAIKERVAEGRWEPLGGMWVEADCNLSGPESLARQFLLGRTFFQEHFGRDADSPVLWLPDVFGYAWALPQLIKQAGLDYFMTIKIGWNQYNRLPYDSFWWQGLDGTRVLTHFSTTPDVGGGFGASTYNAMAVPEQAITTWTNFQQKELQQELLMIFGYGDGGGGPTREMLENFRELEAFPATPRMRQDSAGDFFRNLETTSGDRLPTWNAELYFELHRGTYTTQSRNKRANRKSEFLLHDAEYLATLAAMLDSGYEYPAATIRKAWELVCLNQFHDIIPGSSINPVYVESLEQYAEIEEMGSGVRDKALQAVATIIGSDILVVNPTSFVLDDLAYLPEQLQAGERLQRPDGVPVPTQVADGGTWAATGELAPFSVTPLAVAGGNPPELDTELNVSPTLLENAYLRVELDPAGDIVRILDKANDREVLPAGTVANQFQALEDRPMNWDAWDVDIFIDDKMWTAEPATSVEVVEAGPLRATLEIRRRVLNSNYVQRISLSHNSARLDFDTQIDWRERHIMLKVAFPVEVFSPVATYEIQWGNVERPTHSNTSWDWARFETCAQKWVDLSEGGYGISLLNDCKYGHDIKDNVMRISLLRGPTSPDPEADQGEHRFAYSLLPHAGGWGETTIAAAYALNDPLIVWVNPGELESSAQATQVDDSGDRRVAVSSHPSFVSVDQPNVVVETIKRAEDGNGLIVRLYESQRRRGLVTLTAAFEVAEAWHANLLEENETELEASGNQVTLSIKPYEIVTVRLIPVA
ncbi:MAG: alpha-mannosidase [Chloroflexota bacterium]|nr:alpha-mannosidase [Chloroflexota bacterium]